MLAHNAYTTRCWAPNRCSRLPQAPVAHQHMQRHQRQHFQLQHHAMAHLQYKRTTQEASLADGPAPLNVAPPVYDRQQMQQLFTQRPDLAISRVLQVLTALAKLALLQIQHSSKPPAGTSYAGSVRQLVSELGVLWVKLGQTLSVRPDLVGKRLAAALAGLQEGAPPFDDATAAAIISSDLGRPPSELFAWLSPAPVASASLGQVYQARLAADDTLVAVKVQRPDVWPQVQVDLGVLLLLLRLLRWAGRIKQDITLWADTLGRGLAQELDYQQEARNLELFAAAHSQLGFVTTPDVVWQLTSHRVLTTTWVDGRTPGQILRQARRHAAAAQTAPGAASQPQQPPQPQQQPTTDHPDQLPHQQQLLQLVTMGVEASLCQLVTTGVLHADPHPGNLLLTREGQLAYIDFGLLVQVPPPASLAMMGALLHWALADWQALAHDLGAMGLLKQSTDRAELAADLEQHFTRLYAAVPADGTDAAAGREPATGGAGVKQQQQQQQQSLLLFKAGAISFGDFAGVIAALAVKYRFELPPYYTLVIRSLTTLEGFALLADPNARRDIARAAVRAIARQLLVDQRPAAQQLLCDLLRSPTRAGCINLPLLQELLSLQQQPQQYLGPQQQQRKRRNALRQQPWLLLLLQQYDAAQMAQQLSSVEAASLRAAAVQHLSKQQGVHHMHPHSREGHSRAASQDGKWLQRQVARSGRGDALSHQLRTTSGKEAGHRSQTARQPPLLMVVQWLWRSRWRGLLLVGQLLALFVMASAQRLAAALPAVVAAVLSACKSRH